MAYANCIFDHWTLVEGDPLGLAPNALLDDIITPLRLSKGHVRQSMCVRACARAFLYVQYPAQQQEKDR
jgi:hypothetical protein